MNVAGYGLGVGRASIDAAMQRERDRAVPIERALESAYAEEYRRRVAVKLGVDADEFRAQLDRIVAICTRTAEHLEQFARRMRQAERRREQRAARERMRRRQRAGQPRRRHR